MGFESLKGTVDQCVNANPRMFPDVGEGEDLDNKRHGPGPSDPHSPPTAPLFHSLHREIRAASIEIDKPFSHAHNRRFPNK